MNRNWHYNDFLKNYEGFLHNQAKILATCPGVDLDDAAQDVRMFAWEAVTHERFNSWSESPSAWIFQRVVWGVQRKISVYRRSYLEVPASASLQNRWCVSEFGSWRVRWLDNLGESDVTYSDVFRGRFYDIENQVEARIALERIERFAETSLPEGQRRPILAVLQRTEEVIEHSQKSKGGRAGVATYEVASGPNLSTFLNHPWAAKMMERAQNKIIEEFSD